MASLALIASLVVLATIFVGPLTYILARLKFPAIIIYIMSIFCVVNGVWFAMIGLPVWYLGLIPIYFGYISIVKANENQTKA